MTPFQPPSLSLFFFFVFYCVQRQQGDEVADNDHITVLATRKALLRKSRATPAEEKLKHFPFAFFPP